MVTGLMVKALEQKKATAPTAATMPTMNSKTKTGGQTRASKKTKAGQTMTIDDACASNESRSVLDSLTLCKR